MTTLVRLWATLVTAAVLTGAPALARQRLGLRHAQLEPTHASAFQTQPGMRSVPQALRTLVLPARKPEAAPTTLPEFANPLKRRRMALPAGDWF
jgi:hypothetical protein